MDIKALKNIFNKETATRYCTVVERLSATRYTVEDTAGRVAGVESTEFYPPGAPVVVQLGRIVGRGSRSGQHKVYEV